MIEVKDISFSYGEKRIFDHFSAAFPGNSITALTGRSGSGKTTLLRLIAGLEKPQSGSIQTEEDIAVLFQEPRLFPWMNARENLLFVQRPSDRRQVDPEIWLKRIDMGEDGGKYPAELSGGMQQRIAIARTLIYAQHCNTVLLDEPFKGLDEDLKAEMIRLVRNYTKEKTVLVITHDPKDAQALGAAILQIGADAAENRE